jgi:hypothetical protein
VVSATSSTIFESLVPPQRGKRSAPGERYADAAGDRESPVALRRVKPRTWTLVAASLAASSRTPAANFLELQFHLLDEPWLRSARGSKISRFILAITN